MDKLPSHDVLNEPLRFLITTYLQGNRYPHGFVPKQLHPVKVAPFPEKLLQYP